MQQQSYFSRRGVDEVGKKGAVGSLHSDQSTSIWVGLPTKPSTVHVPGSFESPAPRAERARPLPRVLITTTYGAQEFHVTAAFAFFNVFLFSTEPAALTPRLRPVFPPS